MRRFLVGIVLAFLAWPALAEPPPANFPGYLRWDLVPKWIDWNGTKENVTWPPIDGCDVPATRTTLLPGILVDRFGRENGEFVSPAGANFRARATPYICGQMDYHVYRVDRPLSAQGCTAAPWFGEPGGATQIKFDAPVEKLVATGALVPLTTMPAGNPETPQCRGP